MKHTSGIYLVINLITNEKYVGQSIDVETRWKQHLMAAQNPKENTLLYQAIRQYGKENFSCELLEECSKEKLNEREIYWIDYYDTFQHGYNMTHGGQGSYGWKFNPDEIYRLWDEGKSIKEIQIILGCSEQLISNRLKGYKDYDRATAFARNFSMPIYQYSLLGEYINFFPSASAAAKALGHNRNDTILACANNKINSAYGYQWNYKKVDKMPIIAAPHSKLVQCIETGEIFTSTKEAAKACNLKSHSNIIECISGKKKSAGKHPITGEKLHWQYISSLAAMRLQYKSSIPSFQVGGAVAESARRSKGFLSSPLRLSN